MALQSFSDNYEDNSTEEGFQFTFYCDLCREGFKSRFIPAQTAKKKSFFSGLGQAVSIGASLLGKDSIGYNVERGADLFNQRFEGMSSEWHKEHEQAFQIAQNESKAFFHRCPKCKQWACDNDWNDQEGLCVDCAPRENIEVAAAKAAKMVKDIEVKAENTVVFNGEIESKTTICPVCGKPSGKGKFCNNCGAPLEMNICQTCGAKNQPGARFCGECGGKLI